MLTWYKDTPDEVHDLPETWSDQPTHHISTDCWCKPQLVDRVRKHVNRCDIPLEDDSRWTVRGD